MKWSSFFILCSFLLATNVMVSAQGTSSSALNNSIDRYTQPPQEVTNLLGSLGSEQLAKLPEPVRNEAVRRRGAAIDALRAEALSLNPITNGSFPTSVPSSLPPSLSPTISSASPVSRPTDTAPSAGTTNTTSAPQTRNLGGTDPLQSITNYLNISNELAKQTDLNTLDLATKREVQQWKDYYGTTYDRVMELKDNYSQIKNIFAQYREELDAMVAKLPATIPNCTRPS